MWMGVVPFELRLVPYSVCVYTALVRNRIKPCKGMLADILKLDSLSDPDDFARAVFESLQRPNKSVGIKVSGSSNVTINNCSFGGLGTAIESSDSSLAINGMVVTSSNIGIHDISEGTEMSNIKVGNIKAKRVGTVARLPAENVNFEAGDIEMEDVGIGIDVYLTPRQLQEIGLPVDTPQEYIKEVKDLVENSESQNEVWRLIESTSLYKWLNTAAIATTLSVPAQTVLSSLVAAFGG